MKRILWIPTLILIAASAVSAQTISPITFETSKKIDGSYTVHNNTLAPVSVTIEIVGCTYDKTGRHFAPLPSTTHVTLSETSFRLGPQATEEIDYKGRTDSVPSSFAFVTTMTLGHTVVGKDNQAFQVKLVLPETVFVCNKASKCREQTLRDAGLWAGK
jgi:hypothetical protein